MNSTLKKLGLAAAIATSVLIPAAYASGIFQGYPIVGSAAFCESQNSQSTSPTVPGTIPSGNCTTTVPAGPTVVTGLEVVPMDTGVANGGGAATVLLPSTWLDPGYYQIVTTGTSVTVAPGAHTVVLNLAATTMAVTMPAAPYDNETVTISNSSTIVSTFSVVANTGQTLVQGAAPTSLAAQAANTAATAQSEVAYLYQASSKKWFRLQ